MMQDQRFHIADMTCEIIHDTGNVWAQQHPAILHQQEHLPNYPVHGPQFKKAKSINQVEEVSGSISLADFVDVNRSLMLMMEDDESSKVTILEMLRGSIEESEFVSTPTLKALFSPKSFKWDI